jgi:hypothetical protein
MPAGLDEGAEERAAPGPLPVPGRERHDLPRRERERSPSPATPIDTFRIGADGLRYNETMGVPSDLAVRLMRSKDLPGALAVERREPWAARPWAPSW